MRYLPKNTLAYYNAAPQFHTFDLSSFQTGTIAASTKAFRDIQTGDTMAYPDRAAIDFYALNHCASIIRKKFTANEPLPEWAIAVMDGYLAQITEQGQRMLHYLLYITTREARHLHGMKEDFSFDMVESLFGANFRKFISKKSSESTSIDLFLDGKVQCTLEQYMGGISYCFENGSYSGGYGGPPWANVANCALSFITGQTSLEVMVDTAYTLAHNNGPIFNKGAMYHNYTDKFTTILDVQRGGQMAEFVLESTDKGHEKLMGNPYYPYVGKTTYALVKKTWEACPDEFNGFVNWYTVEALGAVDSYEDYKLKQKKAHPESVVDAASLAQKIQKEQGLDAPVSTGNLEGYFTTSGPDFQVFPGQAVKTFTRVAKLPPVAKGTK